MNQPKQNIQKRQIKMHHISVLQVQTERKQHTYGATWGKVINQMLKLLQKRGFHD